MDLIIPLALLMIWIVAVVILAMTYYGYDVRSRGFKATGPVAATLPKLGITLKDYFKKRDEHPVCDDANASKAKTFKILTSFGIILTAVFVVVIIVLAVL